MIYAISDTHLCDKTNKDDFHAENELLELITKIKTDTEARLVIVGDFLDIWQCDANRILFCYSSIFAALQEIRDKLYLISGNHDSNLRDVMTPLHIPVFERIIITKTVFFHGHQVDPFYAKYAWLGKIASKIGGWLEKALNKDIDIWFEDLAKRITGTGRHGDEKKFAEAAVQFVRDFECIDTVVCGHTHKFRKDGMVIAGINYMNTGTWTGDKRDVLMLT